MSLVFAIVIGGVFIPLMFARQYLGPSEFDVAKILVPSKEVLLGIF